MTRKQLALHRVLAILLPLALAIPGIGHGAPGTLADKPLFLSSTVKPNVLMLVDDSGSMDWEVLLSNRALELHPEAPNRNWLDPTPAGGAEQAKTEWREFCTAYNTLAYDPQVEYTPWSGMNVYGNAFRDASSTNAPFHPYYPDIGAVDLEDSDCEEGDLQSQDSDDDCGDPGDGFFYVPWTDANNNGVYDMGECLPDDEGAGEDAFASKVYVRDMSVAEKQNYANWFSFYRKREYVAKRAFTELTAGADMRMGLATLHDNNGVGTAVRDIGDADPDGDKTELLRNLARINSNRGTPLRRTLRDAGRYFDRERTDGYANLGFSEPSPILDAEPGGACQQNFVVMMSDGYWNGWDPGVGNTDADGDGPFDGGSHADDASNTLADVAMKYYEDDLADSIVNRVPTQSGVDENNAQHLVTFGVAFGVNGTVPENPDNRDEAFDWPTPQQDEPTTIDDLRHAAWNGRGEFLNAGNPQELITSLRGAFSTIAKRVGASSGVSFSSTSLQDDSAAYLATFNSSDWSGDLVSVPLDDKTGAPQNTINWSAAELLDGLDTQRSIFTYYGKNGVAFEWENLSDAQKNDLRTSPSGGLQSVATGQARLDYLRGDRTHEADGTAYDFRRRGSRLGDVVHSQPVEKNGVVFVGANDGMLHGFDTETGTEVMAYVPATLSSTAARRGLHYLTNPTYSHRYYVDMTPTVTRKAVDGKDYLVGALGAGGRGLFALDVTDPKSFDADDVLWEFSASDDDELGHTFSKPLIAKVWGSNGPQWAVIVGNGYNDRGEGEATLFVLNLHTGEKLAEISTGEGTPEDRNGLATPAAIDQDGDGVVDRVYAGDLKGQMWAFDLSSQTVGNWSGEKLFSANDNQPITSAPTVISHPYIRDDVGNQPNVLLLFGTGQLLTESDRYSTGQQSLYGVWDRGDSNLTRGDLTAQPFERADDDVRILGDKTVLYGDPNAEGNDGWYIDLPAGSRERVLSSPVVRGDAAFFTTQSPASAPCDAGGNGWLLAVRLDNGGQTATPVFDYDSDGVVGDEDDYVDDAPPAGLKFNDQGLPSAPSFIGDRVLIACSDKSGFCNHGEPPQGSPTTTVSPIANPFSWEELVRE